MAIETGVSDYNDPYREIRVEQKVTYDISLSQHYPSSWSLFKTMFWRLDSISSIRKMSV
jgi:hypothetical protein